MKTDSVKSYSPNFGRIRFYEHSKVAQPIQEAILSAPAVKKFGKKYDAIAGIQYFFDEKKNIHLGLLLEDIEPANLLVKISDHFKGKKYLNFINFNAHKTNEAELISEVRSLNKNFFVDIYDGMFF